MFRLLRTNLQFLAAGKENKVILITSSFGGEGKSFITVNLGMSLALARKKVILLGFDLRKPKLSTYLTGEALPSGLTNYLIGESNIDDIINKVPNYENIDVIGSGPIPPNPSELLMGEKIDELFNYLKTVYDYILHEVEIKTILSNEFCV